LKGVKVGLKWARVGGNGLRLGERGKYAKVG